MAVGRAMYKVSGFFRQTGNTSIAGPGAAALAGLRAGVAAAWSRCVSCLLAVRLWVRAMAAAGWRQQAHAWLQVWSLSASTGGAHRAGVGGGLGGAVGGVTLVARPARLGDLKKSCWLGAASSSAGLHLLSESGMCPLR